MYIRAVKTRSKGIEYIVHRLVESYRTEDGAVRQRVIMNLGTLDVPRSKWAELAELLEQRIHGITSFMPYSEDLDKVADDLFAKHSFAKAKPQIKEEAAKERDLATVDLNSIQTSESRSLGPELVGEAQWKELEFDAVLSRLAFTPKEQSIAKALILGRLIHPDSEIGTIRWFKTQSALTEMTMTDIVAVGKDRFYEVADLLYEHREAIESHLYDKETDLFALDRKIFLFDLTNTYIEGSGKNNKQAKYGKSKEKRTDCPLIALALMVDERGFPVYSRIYEGSQSEPQTLEDVIAELEIRSTPMIGAGRPILVMDRGIATTDNLKLLKEKGYSYTVVERRPAENGYEAEYSKLKTHLNDPDCGDWLKQNGWSAVGSDDGVYVKKLKKDDGNVDVLSFSIAREYKETVINKQREERFLEEVRKLQNSVEKGSVLLVDKVNKRIGRILEKYPGMAKVYEISIELREDNNKKVKCVVYKESVELNSRNTLAGCYVITTDRDEFSADEIWQTYSTLTRVESAFRDLKSDLGLRPIYHSTEARTQAHLFIGILAYHLLVSIETKLRVVGDNREWRTIREILSTHQRCSVTIVGERNEIYSLRLSGKPEPEQQKIYSALNVTDPLKRIKSVIDSS